MPKFANKLDQLLADTVLCSRKERQLQLLIVRSYIAKINPERLNKEIAEITSEPELNMLQAAGVPQAANTVFLETVQKISIKSGRK